MLHPHRKRVQYSVACAVVVCCAVSHPVLWLPVVLWLHRYKTPAEVAAEGHAEELEQQVATMEAMWGLTLAPGYDPQLTCMAHLWEVSHRLGLGHSMIVYVIVCASCGAFTDSQSKAESGLECEDASHAVASSRPGPRRCPNNRPCTRFVPAAGNSTCSHWAGQSLALQRLLGAPHALSSQHPCEG